MVVPLVALVALVMEVAGASHKATDGFAVVHVLRGILEGLLVALHEATLHLVESELSGATVRARAVGVVEVMTESHIVDVDRLQEVVNLPAHVVQNLSEIHKAFQLRVTTHTALMVAHSEDQAWTVHLVLASPLSRL